MIKTLNEYRLLTQEFGNTIFNLKRIVKYDGEIEFPRIHRFSLSAYDCLYAFDIAAEYSVELLKVNKEQLASWKLDRTTDIQPKYFEVRRLELMYKSLFYFLRVFQDEAYKLLLEITGSASGPSSSMTKIFKSELNSVTQRLKSDFPDYFEWFEDLRERRNKIKAYGDFDSNFKSDDIEIRFKVIAGNDKELNERNLDLNVPDVNFGEYFEDAILKCIKLNKLIFDMYIEQRNKNET